MTLVHESLLEKAGFGPWQGLIFLCVAMSQYFESMTNIAFVFIAYTPNSMCIAPQNSTFTETPQCQLNSSVACEAWQYDKSVLGDTVVTEWNLVCDRKYRAADTQLVYMLGFILGSLVSGFASDWWGRKKLFVCCGFLTGVLGVMMAQAPNMILFLILRFLVSFFNTATYQAGFVLCMETTTSRYRTWMGAAFYMPYALGYTSLSAITFWLRDWRSIQTFISAPVILDVFLWWILPESPAWLIQKGRTQEASQVLKAAAKMNGKENEWEERKGLKEDSLSETDSAIESLREMLTHGCLIVRYIAVGFVWFAVALVYYGVSFMVGSFDTSIFVGNAIAGAVELPAYMLCYVLLRVGRRCSMMWVMIVVSLAFMGVAFAEGDYKWLQLPVAMVGKLGVTACFAIIYVMTAELYPTSIRNSGLSISAMCGRIGSCVAPYIAVETHDSNKRFYFMMLFCVLSLFASMACIILPETNNGSMPDKIQDVLKQRSFGRIYPDEQNEETSDAKDFTE